MKQKLKRGLRIGAVIFIIGFVVLNFIAYRQAYAMTHFVSNGARTAKPEDLGFLEKIQVLFWGVDLPRPGSAASPNALSTNCQKLTITETNGVRLGAWYVPAESNHPLVILFHGYAGDKTSVAAQARIFMDLGLSVLLVDFRGSGESSEAYTSIGHDEANDVAAVVNYTQTNLPHSKLVLYGISMGAAAELAAVDHCGVKPDAIIAEAVFDKMLATVRHRFELMKVPAFPAAQLLVFWGGCQFGFNAFANNPVDFARSVQCPILFLHGADDKRALLSEARQVYDAVPGPKWFKEFPNIGHGSIASHFHDQWTEAVAQFLTAAHIINAHP